MKTLTCENPRCGNTFPVTPYRRNKRFCCEKCRKQAWNIEAYGKKIAPQLSPSTPPPPPSAMDRVLLGHTARELLEALTAEIEPLCQKRAYGDVVCWRFLGSLERRKDGFWRFSLRDGKKKMVQVNLAASLTGSQKKRKKVAFGRAVLTLMGHFSLGYLVGEEEIEDKNVQYSHLCHHEWCCNPAHGCGEEADYNKSRYGCHSGAITSCPHDPKCLLMGRKILDDEEFDEHSQLLSQFFE